MEPGFVGLVKMDATMLSKGRKMRALKNQFEGHAIKVKEQQ